MAKSKLEQAREQARLLQEKRKAARLSEFKSPAKRKASPTKPETVEKEKRLKPTTSTSTVTKSKPNVSNKRKSLAELAMEQAKKKKRADEKSKIGASGSKEQQVVDIAKTPPKILLPKSSTNPRKKAARMKPTESLQRKEGKKNFQPKASRYRTDSSTFYTPQQARKGSVKLRTSSKRKTRLRPVYYSDVESDTEDTPVITKPIVPEDSFCTRLKKAITCSIALYVIGLVCLFMLDYMNQLVPFERIADRIGIEPPSFFPFQKLQPQDIVLPLLESGMEDDFTALLKNVKNLPVKSLIKASTETLVRDLELEASEVIFWKDSFEKLSEKSKEEVLNQQIKDLAQKIKELNRSVENMQNKALAYVVITIIGGWVLGPVFL